MAFAAIDDPMFVHIPTDPMYIPIPRMAKGSDGTLRTQELEEEAHSALIPDDVSDSCHKYSKSLSMARMGEVVAKRAVHVTGKYKQWWKSARVPLTCPFTGFPIKFLPYPPFKLNTTSKPSRTLVDGKSLALSLIAECNFVANGWCANAADVVELSDYVDKFKLGIPRPDHAMALVSDAESTQSSSFERGLAAQKLKRMVSYAKKELTKIRCIQEKRVVRLYEELVGHVHIDTISKFDAYDGDQIDDIGQINIDTISKFGTYHRDQSDDIGDTISKFGTYHRDQSYDMFRSPSIWHGFGDRQNSEIQHARCRGRPCNVP